MIYLPVWRVFASVVTVYPQQRPPGTPTSHDSHSLDSMLPPHPKKGTHPQKSSLVVQDEATCIASCCMYLRISHAVRAKEVCVVVKFTYPSFF